MRVRACAPASPPAPCSHCRARPRSPPPPRARARFPQGVHIGRAAEDIGAGDQGIMFGYASDETEELMPLTIVLANKIGLKLTEVRKDGTCPWVRPDGKTQVTVEYKQENGVLTPLRVHTVVISTQHSEDVTNEVIRAELMEKVIKPVVPAHLLDDKTIYHLNPSGRFVIGGPHGDAGLTGRKIIIDSYGGWGAHGGGAFSGKDPSKVDRSAAYAARWIAKSIVAAKLAHRILIQVSYAIGVAKPLSINVETYGTGAKSDEEIVKIIEANFDLRPGCIIRDLHLKRPIYFATAAYGHFGRSNKEFTWGASRERRGARPGAGRGASVSPLGATLFHRPPPPRPLTRAESPKTLTF